MLDFPITHHFRILENEAYMKLLGRQSINFATALFIMRIPGPVHNMVQQYKYHGDQRIGKWCGQLFGKQLLKKDFQDEIDIIVPVPIHARKLKLRGFNQSEIFAMGISEQTDIPVSHQVLNKHSNNASQTSMSRTNRIINTMNSFQLNNSKGLQSKHILLVDDVLTTGATLEACIIQLKKIPDVKISIGIIAMTKS
jgi:ComF family protein